MHLGNYQINLDAVLARLVYRWRYPSLTLATLLMGAVGAWTGCIPPFWNGHASLVMQAAEGATILVDAQPWPHAIYAGRHSVTATLPDGRSAWADIDLLAGQALTLTLPAGLPAPQERSLPPAAAGTHIDHVWWADGGWRVRSVADPVSLSEDAPMDGAAPPPAPAQTVAVSGGRVERLSTLDAYAGLADQVHRDSRLLEAVYRPQQLLSAGSQARGAVEVRGWAAGLLTVPISEPLTLLRFSPTGTALLMAEQVPTGGEQVYVMTQDAARIPAVAVPGQITRLSWHPDGSAVVLHSVQNERLTLTLVRLAPSVIAAAIADLDAAAYAGRSCR